jgi:hypothetical protein
VAYLPEPSSKEGQAYRKRFKDKVTKGANYGEWGMNPTVESRLKNLPSKYRSFVRDDIKGE